MSVSLVIRKQKFTIKTGDEQTAMRLRRQVNDELQYSLLDVYSEVMNASGAGFDQDIYIDKITVNLGRCTEEEWAKKLPHLLKKKLQACMGGYDSNADESFQSDSADREQEAAIVTGQYNEMTALVYFLEKGIYPWWFTSAIVPVRKPAEIIAGMPDGMIESVLVKLISGSYSETVIERMRQRFVATLPVNDYKRIIHLLILLQSDESWKANMLLLCAADTERYLASFTSVSEETYHLQLIGFLLQHARTGTAGLKEFIQQLFEYTATAPGPQPRPDINKATIHDKVKEIIAQLAAAKHDETGAPIDASIGGESVAEAKNDAIDTTEATDAPQCDKQAKKQRSKTDLSEDFPEEGIYIGNGGLALLHPFLQPLFDEFGLLEGDHFVSAEAQQRAAVLLYYLHHNTPGYEEYEMAFNKILCGLSVEDVLPAGIVLTEEEMKECDQLLDTVVRYWEALKGSSKEALQEAFLQRKAKLRFKGDHWLMQVERNAMDILIDRLPWGFGIIKLPWLKQLIHVEW